MKNSRAENIWYDLKLIWYQIWGQHWLIYNVFEKPRQLYQACDHLTYTIERTQHLVRPWWVSVLSCLCDNLNVTWSFFIHFKRLDSLIYIDWQLHIKCSQIEIIYNAWCRYKQVLWQPCLIVVCKSIPRDI